MFVVGTGERRDARIAAVIGGAFLAASTMLAAGWMVAHQAPLMAVKRCVSADGPLAWLGLQLALLRDQSDCGAGQYGLDASPGHVVGIVALVAVPTLLVNLFSLMGIVGFAVTLRALLVRAARKAAEILRRLWPRLPRAPRFLPFALRWVPRSRPVASVSRPWQLDHSPATRRGPPVPLTF